MPVPDPQRRERRRTHLDASAVPVERALLARARALAQEVVDTPDAPPEADALEVMKNGMTLLARSFIAEELERLAEELHYW